MFLFICLHLIINTRSVYNLTTFRFVLRRSKSHRRKSLFLFLLLFLDRRRWRWCWSRCYFCTWCWTRIVGRSRRAVVRTRCCSGWCPIARRWGRRSSLALFLLGWRRWRSTFSCSETIPRIDPALARFLPVLGKLLLDSLRLFSLWKIETSLTNLKRQDSTVTLKIIFW